MGQSAFYRVLALWMSRGPADFAMLCVCAGRTILLIGQGLIILVVYRKNELTRFLITAVICCGSSHLKSRRWQGNILTVALDLDYLAINHNVDRFASSCDIEIRIASIGTI